MPYTYLLLTLMRRSIVMGIIVFFSLKIKINPDNVATPIAAALGDLVTLALFAGVGAFLHVMIKPAVWWCY